MYIGMVYSKYIENNPDYYRYSRRLQKLCITEYNEESTLAEIKAEGRTEG